MGPLPNETLSYEVYSWLKKRQLKNTISSVFGLIGINRNTLSEKGLLPAKVENALNNWEEEEYEKARYEGR